MLAPERLVSVIIPTFNRMHTLGRAIRSVLNQTYHNFELLIIDDASQDDTENIVSSFHDPRICYFRLSENLGGAVARNEGISMARGEYIAFLDSDDEWLSEKLEIQIRLFNELDDDAGLIYAGLRCLDDNANFIEEYFFKFHAKTGALLNELLVNNFIGSFSSVVIKRKYLKMVGGLDPTFKSCQDWELYIRLSKICRFACTDECLVNYYAGKTDPVRISRDRFSLILGNQMIKSKFEEDYRKLSRQEMSRYYARLVYFYASVGILDEVWRCSLAAYSASRDVRLLLALPRRLARCFKSLVTQKYGY